MTTTPWDEVLKRINPTGAKLEAGVVEAVAGGTIDVNLGGTVITNVRVAGGLLPEVGQYVWLIRQGATAVALPRSGVDGYGMELNGPLGIARTSGYASVEMSGPSGAYIDFKDVETEDQDARIIYVSGSGQLEVKPKLYVNGPLDINAGSGNHISLTDPSIIAHSNTGGTTGSVNIGWDSNWYRFRMSGNSTPNGVLISDYDNPRLYLTRGGAVQANASLSGTGPAFSFFGDPDTGMYSYGANALGFATGGTFAFRIDANQNMIGNNMAVVGLNYIRTANGSNTQPAYQFTNDTDTGIYLSSTGNLSFTAGGTLGFTMNNGTMWANSSSGSLSTSTPRVVMSHSANYLLMSRDGSAALYLMRQTTDGRVAEFYRTTTLVGSISVTTTGTLFNETSDYRLKENISDMTGSFDLIRRMRPVWFTWKDHPYEGITGGFIAHELQEVYPRAVTGEKDAVNEDGTIDPQGVDNSKLVPLLVAAVQTLDARVEALEAAAT